jgi:hypothetical protein
LRNVIFQSISFCDFRNTSIEKNSNKKKQEMKFFLLVTLCVATAAAATSKYQRPQRPQAGKPQEVQQPQAVRPQPPPSSPQQQQNIGDALPLAEPCDPQRCIAPHCRCSQYTLDDKTPVDKIPQVKTN